MWVCGFVDGRMGGRGGRNLGEGVKRVEIW